MKMKSRSLFVVASIALVIGLPTYYIYAFYTNSQTYFESDVAFRKRVMTGYLNLAKALVETEQEPRLIRILDDGITARMFDWYTISKNGQTTLYNPPGMEQLEIAEIDGKVYDDERKVAATIALTQDTFLTIGVNKRWSQYFKTIFSEQIWITIQENLIYILIVLLVFAYLLKDMFKITKALKAGKGLAGLGKAESKALTKEGQIFSEIMRGYQQSVDRLSHEKQMLEGQVLPSLRSELASGKTPPYEFDCVMVRTDINRYSQMFVMGERAERDVLMIVIHRFFSEATKIVSRYGGYMHEFVGDELIFYIKDEEVPNAVSMALSCLTEIQAATDTFQGEIQNTFKLPFTIKSSLASGKLRYGPLVNGFALAGPPLIESVRILSLIDDRDRHQVFVAENIKERADLIFTFESKGDFLLKGYNHNRAVYELIARKPLESLLNEISTAKIPWLASYRNPKEILAVFQFLQKVESLTPGDILKILLLYRDVFIGGSYPELRDILMSLVEHFRGRAGGETITPTVIRMTMGLVAKDLYNSAMSDFFLEALDVESDRGVANTLEAYGYFENVDVYGLYRRFKDKGSARVVGNILLLWGERQITNELCEIFLQKLKAKDQAIVASCLYAFAEIVAYWHEKDLVYIKAQIEFFELEIQIEKIEKNQSLIAFEPVQRQLKRAKECIQQIRTGT